MKTRFVSHVRMHRWQLAALLVVAAVSAVLVACGGGSSDRAFVNKFMAMWDSNDAAAAKQLFAEQAIITWPAGDQIVGIQAIGSAVTSYPVDPMPVGDTAFTYVPSDKDMKLLGVKYKSGHFVACPVAVGGDLYMMVLQIQDGKVLNQWVSSMYN